MACTTLLGKMQRCDRISPYDVESRFSPYPKCEGKQTFFFYFTRWNRFCIVFIVQFLPLSISCRYSNKPDSLRRLFYKDRYATLSLGVKHKVNNSFGTLGR